jgi:hypothetical protein
VIKNSAKINERTPIILYGAKSLKNAITLQSIGYKHGSGYFLSMEKYFCI